MTNTVRTQVAIVGAGPAGLLLSHLLSQSGIASIVIDSRTRADIEGTVKAGTLEYATVNLLRDSGACRNAATVAERHDGIELWFDGAGHRVDFVGLTGKHANLYPQHEVLIDLIATRLDLGQDLRFETTAVGFEDTDSATPTIVAKGPDGVEYRIVADFLVGADGSRSVVRPIVNGSMTAGYFREYPFAWFGILTRSPRNNEELIYSNSPDGFALISQRNDEIQRMYIQCDPEADPNELGQDALWDEFQKRVPGKELKRGEIFQRDILRFRSFVVETMRRGRTALVGDAAHTVPPTGAKGVNLAVGDVVLLTGALKALFADGSETALDEYQERAYDRIWKAQHFSWWMTQLTHNAPDASAFDRRRQLGELRALFGSEAGLRYLAEFYVGWDFATFD